MLIILPIRDKNKINQTRRLHGVVEIPANVRFMNHLAMGHLLSSDASVTLIILSAEVKFCSKLCHMLMNQQGHGRTQMGLTCEA